MLCKAFEPWILSVPSSKINNKQRFITNFTNTFIYSDYVLLPFDQQQHREGATAAITAFCAIAKHIQNINPKVISHVWYVYANILAQDFKPVHLQLYHVPLLSLDWSAWHQAGFNDTNLVQLLQLAHTNDVHKINFVRCVVQYLPWGIIEHDLSMFAIYCALTC